MMELLLCVGLAGFVGLIDHCNDDDSKDEEDEDTAAGPSVDNAILVRADSGGVVQSTEGDDYILGEELSATDIFALSGNDLVVAGDGSSDLFGGSGQDTLIG